MRKEFSAITRCLPGPGQLRVPGSASSQERYRESCARNPFPNRPVHSRTRTRCLCSVFPMISHLFRARILGMFSGDVVIRFTAFLAPFFVHSRILARLEPRLHGQRWSHFHRTHEFVGLFCRQPITSQYLRHDGATVAALCRAATRLLCICQDTHILTLQWALYAG